MNVLCGLRLVVAVVGSVYLCFCADLARLLIPLGSLPLCPHTVLAGSQADGQGRVCQHSCLLRGSVTDTM